MNRMIQFIFIFPIRVYQWVISPVLQGVFGMRCRYEPSCSYYMVDAIKEWGVIKGIILGTKRIGSCNPFGGHGYDPVPKNPKRSKKDAK